MVLVKYLTCSSIVPISPIVFFQPSTQNGSVEIHPFPFKRPTDHRESTLWQWKKVAEFTDTNIWVKIRYHSTSNPRSTSEIVEHRVFFVIQTKYSWQISDNYNRANCDQAQSTTLCSSSRHKGNSHKQSPSWFICIWHGQVEDEVKLDVLALNLVNQ